MQNHFQVLRCFNPTFNYLNDVYVNCLNKYLENPKYADNYNLARADINKGRKILRNSEEVDVYIALYGAHHYYKLTSSFEALNLAQFEGKRLEIFSYGCGPATDTCVLINYLVSNKINLCVKPITLIEPSFVSLQRGKQQLRSIVVDQHRNLEIIRAINKTLENLNTNDISSQFQTIKLHIFSNILDVEQVDLKQLASLLKFSQKGANYFVCVSPGFYSAKQRINRFYSIMS